MDHEAQRVVALYLRRRRRNGIIRAGAVVGAFAISTFRSYLRGHDVSEAIAWSVLVAAVVLVAILWIASWRGWRCPVCNLWLRRYRDPEACPGCNAPFRFTTHRRRRPGPRPG
jgi:hypothetical protein